MRDAGTLTLGVPALGHAERARRPRSPATSAPVPLQVAAAGGGGGNRRARHVYSGRRMELDFVNADIHNILRLIADVGQVNIVTRRRRQGHGHDPHARRAVGSGARRHRQGQGARHAARGQPDPRRAAGGAREGAGGGGGACRRRRSSSSRSRPSSSRSATPTARSILPRIAEVMSPRGKVSVDARTNQLIVTDVAANIELAEELVHNLDTQTPQVLIEARIVEARTTFTRDIGIQWGGDAITSAATGNPTGIAFPSTVGVAGGATDAVTNTQRPAARSVGRGLAELRGQPAGRRRHRLGRRARPDARLAQRRTSTSTCASRRWRTPATCASSRRRRS